ncbi:leucine-rich repeat-containing protein 52-like [Aplochiton taeniatus]
MGKFQTPALASYCPDTCKCEDDLSGINCIGKNFTAFPNELPLNARQIMISHNLITELPHLQLNFLSDLVYLDCYNNSITDISASTFKNLRKLTFLDLSFNKLMEIDNRALSPLSSLVMLRLTDNPRLSEIQPEAFAKNNALQLLDLSRNNLSVFNISFMIKLPNLRSMGLSGNPWKCNCDNEDLCLWVHLEQFKFPEEAQTVCSFPNNMRGKRVSVAGLKLSVLCNKTLDTWDYLFFWVIGYVIFGAGTALAWAMGVVIVLYERYIKSKAGQSQLEYDEIDGPTMEM